MKTEKARISSVRLGLDAYRKAQGRPAQSRPAAQAAGAQYARPQPEPVAPSARELKSTVLKSLHRQSNAGMVSIRDVAQVLDTHLKRG